MLTVEIASQVNEAEWDRAVRQSPSGTLYQTARWAAFMEEYLGAEPHFIAVYDEGRIIARLLLFNEPLGYRRWLFERPCGRLGLSWARKAVPALQWQYGPLLYVQEFEERRRACSRVLSEVHELARCLGAVAVGPSTPPVHGDGLASLAESFSDAAYSASPWATFLVGLDRSEEELWRGLERVARKSIRKCQREGLVVWRAQSEDDLRGYHEASLEMGRRRGERRYSLRNLQVMWRVLRPLGAVEVFVAASGDRVVGGLGVWAWNGILHEFGVARSAASLDQNLGEGDLIKWEILRWGREQGHRVFDLSGFRPDERRTDKEEGIYRFKRKWGGRAVHYPVFRRRGTGLWASLAGLFISSDAHSRRKGAGCPADSPIR